MKFYQPNLKTRIKLPLFISTVPAGFPSPAEEYSDTKLDLNKHLIQNPNSTFFVAISGDSMIGADIQSGDIAIVDRSLEAKSGDIILAVVDGDFTIKRLEIKKDKNGNKSVKLVPENADFEPLEISQENVFQIWGVVTFTIHKSK